MTKVNGAKYYSAANVAALVDVIQPLTAELSKTNYTDVVITDYMSKWVILDTTSIYIKNDTTGEIIWTIKDGWKSDTDRPTTKTPVIVDVVESNKYIADDGVTEEINKNGVLYKLTWNVKDDCLLRTDNYSLHYVVIVDTAEEGFVYGVEYPANGHTYVEYEEDGHNDIDVPNVTIPAYTVTYLNGDVTLQKTYPLVTGDEIPDCEDPDEYTDGDDLYIFSGWKLVSGTEGADGTVGTTNLVYQAVYTLSDDVIIEGGDTPLDPTPNVPKTGDNEDLALAMFGMLLSLAAIAVVLKNKKFFA
jgi:LPXTG-motif cell wall-anchored protein